MNGVIGGNAVYLKTGACILIIDSPDTKAMFQPYPYAPPALD